MFVEKVVTYKISSSFSLLSPIMWEISKNKGHYPNLEKRFIVMKKDQRAVVWRPLLQSKDLLIFLFLFTNPTLLGVLT